MYSCFGRFRQFNGSKSTVEKSKYFSRYEEQSHSHHLLVAIIPFRTKKADIEFFRKSSHSQNQGVGDLSALSHYRSKQNYNGNSGACANWEASETATAAIVDKHPWQQQGCTDPEIITWIFASHVAQFTVAHSRTMQRISPPPHQQQQRCTRIAQVFSEPLPFTALQMVVSSHPSSPVMTSSGEDGEIDGSSSSQKCKFM